MAEADVRRCIDWLEQQKAQMELASFGGNYRTVTEANQQHATSRAQILEYRKQVDKLANKQTLTDAELQAMYGAYQSLETITDKKSGCLEMIKGVASLEDLIQGLSTEFDSRTVHLVNGIQSKRQKNGKGLDNATLVKVTQSCMSAVHKSWRWLDEVMQCAHVHLSNAGAYHQFFHDIEETDYFMNSTLSNIHMTFRQQQLAGDRKDVSDMNAEIKDTQMAYLRWQSKVDNLVARSRDIVPVHKRTIPCKDAQLVVALASYTTGELEFEEGETLTLLDNTDKARWKVKNGKGQTGLVPAVILLINGPTGEALDAAVRLRLQLLGLWTTSVKRLGFQMIAFMQLVFKDWSDEEVRAIQQMPKAERAEITRVLNKVESTLQTNWRGYEGFEDLQERISRLRTILEEADTASAKAGGKVPGTVVFQVKMLENLHSGYQDFWTYWETYKVTTEMSRQPRFILVCDKWDQLRFTSSAHYVRFWDTNLMVPGSKQYKAEAALTIYETPADKRTDGQDIIKAVKTTREESMPINERMEKSKAKKRDGVEYDEEEWSFSNETRDYRITRSGGGGDDEVCEEMNQSKVDKKPITFPEDFVECTESSESYAVNTTMSGAVEGQDEEYSSSMDITEMRRRQETQMDEVTTSMEEVQTVFVIKTVIHPQTQEEISLEEAILAGIIDQAAGKYIDIVSGQTYTLQEAMGNGDIAVEFKSQKTIKKEKSSFGLVTIKTSKETRPYTIKAIIEPKTGKELTIDEAEKKRILDVDRDKYTTETGEVLSILDAIDSGLIKADFHGKPEDSSEVTKTYAVTSMLDHRRNEQVPFSRALTRGLFDPDDGMYVNNRTRDRMLFTDAIIKGYIKARVVRDASALDVDPSNRVIVERMASAQDKIMKQVRVAKAFKAGLHMNGQ